MYIYKVLFFNYGKFKYCLSFSITNTHVTASFTFTAVMPLTRECNAEAYWLMSNEKLP
jgi:hypothetical protein